MREDFVRNQFNLEIKKCCASCVFKKLTNGDYRICSKNREKVKSSDLCDEWLIDPDRDTMKMRKF